MYITYVVTLRNYQHLFGVSVKGQRRIFRPHFLHKNRRKPCYLHPELRPVWPPKMAAVAKPHFRPQLASLYKVQR